MILRFLSLSGLAASPLLLLAQAPPTIDHTPITRAAPGQPIPVTANIDSHGQPLTEVNLHVTTAKNQVPAKIPMQARGAGQYVGIIPASMLAGADELKYYIGARTPLDFTDMDWMEVKVERIAIVPATHPPRRNPGAGGTVRPPPSGGTTRPPPGTGVPVTKEKDRSWVYPAAIVGVGALVVGGIVAASSGGSSGGGGDDDPDPAPTPDPDPEPATPSPTDPADPTDPTTPTTPTTPTVPTTPTSPTNVVQEIINQAANDSVRSAVVNLPVQTVVDPTARIAGRTINRTSINFNYDPTDGRTERFLVLYDGAVVLDTGAVTTAGNANVVVPGGNGVITITVPLSLPDADGVHQWSWAASIAYVVE